MTDHLRELRIKHAANTVTGFMPTCMIPVLILFYPYFYPYSGEITLFLQRAPGLVPGIRRRPPCAAA